MDPTTQNKVKKLDLGDFSKIELILGLSDGDVFSIKNTDSSVYRYDKAQRRIVDENGDSIPSEILLKVINDPGVMDNHGEGLNTYQLMNSMVSKYFGLSAMFGFLALCSFILFKMQVALSLQAVMFLLFMVVSIAGAGVMAGVLLTKLILNKELFL